MEIIYFFTLRVAFKICSKKKKNSKLFKLSFKPHPSQAQQTSHFLTRAQKVFVNYMKESSIHGFSYIADERKHFVER